MYCCFVFTNQCLHRTTTNNQQQQARAVRVSGAQLAAAFCDDVGGLSFGTYTICASVCVCVCVCVCVSVCVREVSTFCYSAFCHLHGSIVGLHHSLFFVSPFFCLCCVMRYSAYSVRFQRSTPIHHPQQQTAAAAWPHVLGILTGHFYHFFTEVWPTMGGKPWLQAPKWLLQRLGGVPGTANTAGTDFRKRTGTAAAAVTPAAYSHGTGGVRKNWKPSFLKEKRSPKKLQ
jgi:hypothetical protein